MIPIEKSNELKTIAILMMMCLHLFNRDFHGLFQPLIFIGKQPLSYYISLFSDACVPIFAFVSGYGLYYKYSKSPESYVSGNKHRLKKLFINYWVILVLFAIILGGIISPAEYPGGITKLTLNITGLVTSYNSSWWFFTIYVFFVLSSKFWFQLLDMINGWLYFIILGAAYLVAFYFRIYHTANYNSELFNYLHTTAALFFCTLFQFMLGAFTLKFKWDIKTFKIFTRIPYKIIIVNLGIVLLIVIHGLVPNFIIAPIIGLAFIFLYIQLPVTGIVHKILHFLAPHATNLWLVHMFFYLYYFQQFVYSPKTPIIIFILLLLISLIASVIVKFFEKPILEKLNL